MKMVTSNLLIWPIVIPLAAALVVLLRPRHANAIGTTAGVATLIAVALLLLRFVDDGVLVHNLGGWDMGLGIALRADALTVSLLLMSALVTLGAGVYATGYFSEYSDRSKFWPLWLMLVSALHALFLSTDLFNLYVTLELMGISAVALAAMAGSGDAIKATLRYLIVGLIGSLMFLFGVVLLYARYGTLAMVPLAEVLQSELSSWTALVLMSTGLLIKCAAFPLHFWLPPAHANAPAPVSAALSALVVKAAFYLLLRLWTELFAVAVTPGAAGFLGALGAGAVLWGSWRAACAPRLKSVAAYSTVAQLGYLFLFISLLVTLPPGPDKDTAYGALLLLALTHGFAKSALFLAAGRIQRQAGHDDVSRLGGTAQSMPVTTFTLALAGVALIGLPPSGTFLAKWELMTLAIATGRWVWVLIIAAGTLLAAIYVFRIIAHTFAPGLQDRAAPTTPILEAPALLLAIVATAVLGLGAAYVWKFLALHLTGLVVPA